MRLLGYLKSMVSRPMLEVDWTKERI
jgi:hypothetical protein